MPLLTELQWRTSHRHKDGEWIALFDNPALECAVHYHRMKDIFWRTR